MIWAIDLGERQRVVRLALEGELTTALNQEVLRRMSEYFRTSRAILVVDGSKLTGCQAVRASWVGRVWPHRSQVEALVVSVGPGSNPLFKASMLAFATQLHLPYELRPGPVTQTNAELRRALTERFHLRAA